MARRTQAFNGEASFSSMRKIRVTYCGKLVKLVAAIVWIVDRVLTAFASERRSRDNRAGNIER